LGLLVGATVLAVCDAIASLRAAPARMRAHAISAAPARRARRRHDRRYEAALPVALEATARSLRGGAGLAGALADAARGAAPASAALASDLRVLADDRSLGLASAANAWARRRSSPSTRLAATAVALAADLGGGAARAFDGVALTLRERAAAADEVRVLGTQARLSALLMGVAPVVFAFLAVATDPRVAGFLFGTPLGWACVVVGGGLDAIGALWMTRISRMAT
jgi:tight adherence protein B